MQLCSFFTSTIIVAKQCPVALVLHLSSARLKAKKSQSY